MPELDASYLAALMLRWERARYELDELETEIRTMVLAIGKTQTVGNVRATYTAGRKTYAYREAAESYLDAGMPGAAEAFARHEQTSYDYNAICKELAILPTATQGALSVTIKTLEKTA